MRFKNRVCQIVRKIINENAGQWKTYKNEKYGFKIKYPPGASLIEGRTFESENSVISVSGYVGSFDVGHKSDEWDFSVDAIEVSPGISFQQYWEKNLKCTPGESLCFDSSFSTYKESEVNGYPAFKTGVPFGGEGELNVSRTAHYVLKDNRIYVIIAYPYYQEASTRIDQIFSTFEFIK